MIGMFLAPLYVVCNYDLKFFSCNFAQVLNSVQVFQPFDVGIYFASLYWQYSGLALDINLAVWSILTGRSAGTL